MWRRPSAGDAVSNLSRLIPEWAEAGGLSDELFRQHYFNTTTVPLDTIRQLRAAADQVLDGRTRADARRAAVTLADAIATIRPRSWATLMARADWYSRDPMPAPDRPDPRPNPFLSLIADMRSGPAGTGGAASPSVPASAPAPAKPADPGPKAGAPIAPAAGLHVPDHSRSLLPTDGDSPAVMRRKMAQVAQIYVFYFNDLFTRQGCGTLADVAQAIPDEKNLAAFLDPLFRYGEGRGRDILVEAINAVLDILSKDTLARIGPFLDSKGNPLPVLPSGVKYSVLLDFYARLARDPYIAVLLRQAIKKAREHHDKYAADGDVKRGVYFTFPE
jgi:hypothetical protein